MNLLNHALALASKGFFVFPLLPGSKDKPLVPFKEFATRDIDQIKLWWQSNQNYNIGIYTGKFNGEGEHLAAIDVDNKGDKKGDETLLDLELKGFEFPPTFEQQTPTGGRHLVYKTRELFKQGVNVLGHGLDIRAAGGYIVGSGSIINGKSYTSKIAEVSDIPDKIAEFLKRPREKQTTEVKIEVNQQRAIARAVSYLATAPVAIQGDGGDQVTYSVACRLKDFGLTPTNATDTMLGYWNEKCMPPWEPSDLQIKVQNAYRYGNDFPGSANPEVLFDKIEEPEIKDPLSELNKEFAFVTAGGKSFVIQETRDAFDNFHLKYHSVQAFHQLLMSKTMMFSGKTHQTSQLWMRAKDRRTYDGMCFMPGKKSPPNFYNLWRGFTVEPTDKVGPEAKQALRSFLDHAFQNICNKNQELFDWLIGYFAHLVQRPWEKPVVAAVFKGGKGVGKNSLIECIGELLNGHYLLASDSRYLIGNFNSHLENCILFVLDEAVWAGSKQMEGRLKDVITGKTHLIERKGFEPYTVNNCTRVVIIGNDDWLVPASHDERRFAVFNVTGGRKNDHKFFREMREGMMAGGHSLLLNYLLKFDLKKADINIAPASEGLAEQKIRSLSPFYEWWLECLKEGRLVYSDFATEWQTEVERDHVRNAYRRFVKERGLKLWGETDQQLGLCLKNCLPSATATRKQNEGTRSRFYLFPDLEQARKEWDTFIGHKSDWT